MRIPRFFLTIPVVMLSLAGFASTGWGQGVTFQFRTNRLDARMIRQPDVSAQNMVFIYGGDIWIASKEGGMATRLSSPRGEEQFPRFSPDGNLIAFSGNYDGNTDVYLVSLYGGVPQRLTHHGAVDRVVGWHPNGREVLFASTMNSGSGRFNQLFRISIQGGLPTPFPVPYGEFAALSPDGKILAYTPISTDFRTWKRYRGGMTSDIWLFNLETGEADNIVRDAANDSLPMWKGDTLYFLSDRDEHKRANLWACDTKTRQFRQLTHFKELDVHFPEIGPEEIVFECGGRLYLMDLETEKYREVKIEVVADLATLKPRVENVSKLIQAVGVSPNAKRAVVEARGEVFTLPAEHGFNRNLTRSSGVAERFPAWSPDGEQVAYFTDRSGEYELALRKADGSGEEKILTTLGPGFRYQPLWSPDSKKIAFIDKAMRIYLHDLDAGKTREVDKAHYYYHGALRGFGVSWSADSRWMTYSRDLPNRSTAIFIYDSQEGKTHQVTSGFYEDRNPAFDPEGKYLYYITQRTFQPSYSNFDNTWIYANSQSLVAVPLRTNVSSPLPPRNDDEKAKDTEKKENEEQEKEKDKKQEKEKGKAEEKPSEGTEEAKENSGKEDQATGKKEGQKDKKEVKPVQIDLDGFEQRLVVLPQKPGNYTDLYAIKGKILYRRLARTGSTDEKSPLLFYDFEKREEKTILDDADGVDLAANHEKLLVRQNSDYAIIEVKENQKLDKKIAMSSLEAEVDPPAEWRQIFTDAWRLQRDYFYDPALHGVDWKGMRERYGTLLNDCITRWDVNYVIGELISELNASHTYRSGGDVESSPTRSVGYLGADFVFTNGHYQISRILQPSPWDHQVRSPLQAPGLAIKAGDYLLAINGIPLDSIRDPWAALQGLADKAISLTVNDQPKLEGSRDLLVQTLDSEFRLRNLDWIESKRKRVDEATQGKVGYIYVPDTGLNGQNELVRQFYGQSHKAGLIIDERFNSGGQIPDRFVELLNRPLFNFWAVRDGLDWMWSPWAHPGPKAMLINGWSGSGGDAFPFYFKKAGLGPLIGMRTWGGLIGITGAPSLIDGGNITVPTFGIYSTEGEWIIEGTGVDPDIEVIDDPGLMAKGIDPQLEKAIDEVMWRLTENPYREPRKPVYPTR